MPWLEMSRLFPLANKMGLRCYISKFYCDLNLYISKQIVPVSVFKYSILSYLFRLLTFSLLRDSGDTIPFATIKSPTPVSIKPVPKVSALQNLLGNTLKSTAKIHMAVQIKAYALKLLTNSSSLPNSCLKKEEDDLGAVLLNWWDIVSEMAAKERRVTMTMAFDSLRKVTDDRPGSTRTRKSPSQWNLQIK